MAMITRHRLNRIYRGAAAGSGTVALALTLLLILSGPEAAKAQLPTTELRSALRASGFELMPVRVPLRGVLVTAESAIRSAVHDYGAAPMKRAFIGQLSVDDVRGRLVFAVQMTGLNLPPLGTLATQTNLHHELIVFVDALTGRTILATSFR
jgi:hypothetical protein